jgi:hypothetical protein
MGLLDFFNYNNSGLKEFADNGLSGLRNTMANTPKMYDPGANARNLMGGQAMQYNQQPQSLIAEKVNAPTTQASFTPQAPTEQQTQQMTYQGTPQAGVNYPNFDSSAINPYLDGDQTDGTGGYLDKSYNNRISQPQTDSMLMGPSQQQQGIVGVDSTAPVYETPTDERDYSKEAQVEVGQPQVSVGGPFDWLNSLLAPNVDREELIRRGIIPPK